MDEKFEKFLKGEEGRENKNFAFVDLMERENLKTVECVERGYFKGKDKVKCFGDIISDCYKIFLLKIAVFCQFIKKKITEKFVLKGEEGRENKNFAFVNPVERENLKTVECVERGYFKGKDENWQRAFELFIYTVIMLSTVFYFYISICKFNGWF